MIYSGKLLSDTVVLKDILRRYEGQDTHTVHLVCIPKNDNCKTKPKSSFPMSATSFETIRASQMENTNNLQANRQNQHVNNEDVLTQIDQNPMNNSNQINFTLNNVSANAASSQMILQNLLWMNQVYTQYIVQYMQM